MFRLFECCALSFFERFVLSFSLKIERFVSDSAEIWICGLYESFKMDSKLADLSLQTILTSIQLMYRNYSGNNHSNRKKEICRKLIQLITEHYKDQRCAQFYADQLGISLQHLSTTVKQVTGKSVLDTIAYIVIIDAKAQLKGTDMTIQEIAYSLNFPNPSFFCKFFRRHVGMSPLEFRNS